MYNDSLETLLSRHYGRSAPAPIGLEQRLIASVHEQAAQQRQQQQAANRIRAYRVSRRRAVKLVAIGSTGLGILGAGLEMLEGTLLGEPAQPAYP